MLKKTGLAVVVAFTLPAAAPPPSISELVRQSVEAIKTDWSQAPNYSFVERDVESKKDGEPTIKTKRVLMIDGSPYNRLIAMDDRPLSPGDEAEEKRELARAIDK